MSNLKYNSNEYWVMTNDTIQETVRTSGLVVTAVMVTRYSHLNSNY